jgi:broad specificity phosphatase PhoE
MVEIIFESHSTTYDNEAKKASGWNDIELSPLGLTQSKELGDRRRDDGIDAIFCSDLQRAYKSAEIAFEGLDIPIIQDKRLRECDYGDLTQHPSSEVNPEKANRISTPFPNGESYEDTAKRMGEFLKDLLRDYDGKRVMVVGHRATQYGLEYWIKQVSMKEAVTAPWSWQPGWEYTLEKL